MTLGKRVLVVDDEPDIRELIAMTLEQMGLEVLTASRLSKAHHLVDNEPLDLCLTDMNLPDGDGMSLVKHIQQHCPHLPVAMITAYGNMDVAIEALKSGAFDFVSKPIELMRLRDLVETALKLGRPQEATEESLSQDTLLGSSPAMEKLKKQIRRVSRSQAPVFISGESGSGKELVARAIHQLGPKSSGPFTPVNCGAIPTELMESEFFGHKKGSFTGAHQDKQGLFQAANGGTLFLDEVADLPLAMQVKLLRAIQEKKVRPVGTEDELPVDIRILSATHKNLEEAVESGSFRQDLFYRINVIELPVPSLRQRSEDIPLLAQHFLKRFAEESDLDEPTLSDEAMEKLTQHSFPGNVRELENTLERAFTLCDGIDITPEDLQLKGQPSSLKQQAIDNIQDSEFDSIDDYIADIEKNSLLKALDRHQGNKTAAAKELGISFRQMRYKLQKHGLD